MQKTFLILFLAVPAARAAVGPNTQAAWDLTRRGAHEEAEAAARAALREDPNDSTAMLIVAVAQTSRAIELDSGKAEAYAARAAAYDGLEETNLMLIDLRAAAAHDPAYQEPLKKIEVALGVPASKLSRARPPGDAPAKRPPMDPLVRIGILLVALAAGGGVLAAIVGRFRKTA